MTVEKAFVALFTRAWIEISGKYPFFVKNSVALFTRAWIEISVLFFHAVIIYVALFTRAWIEIYSDVLLFFQPFSRPLHEGVD